MTTSLVIVCLLGAALGWGMVGSIPLETVPHVDLDRYLGKWFEIARYPNRFERSCDRDVTAEYSKTGSEKIRVVNSCTTPDKKIKQSSGTATIAEPSTNAKLKVSFFWPFYGNYWIIDLDKDYQFAVVGEPSRKYLWILSRSPKMSEPVYQGIIDRLSAKGYDAAKLVRTAQSADSKP